MQGFREAKRVQVFPEGWGSRAIRAKAEVIAGRWQDIRALSLEWKSEWPGPSRAVVIFTFASDPAPPAGLRDLLWDRFGVPVYEQVLSSQLDLLATECDAHEGLHLMRKGVQHQDYSVEEVACGCGDRTPRLCRIEEPARAMKAAAGASGA